MLPNGLGEPLHLSITVPKVGPGVEGTRCVKVRLPNDAPVNIARIHNTLTPDTHHLVLSVVEDPTQDEQALFECPPFRAPLVGAPLTITQKRDEQITLPKGVGYALEAHQLMHLELHYINTGTETVDVAAQADLYPITGDEPIQQAGFLIVGIVDLSIPPKSEYTTGDIFVAQPTELEDATYYAVTGHTHRLGTSVHVGTSDSQDADVNWVYRPDPFNWDAPPVEYLDPGVKLPPGGGFHFSCDWNNTTDDTVKYGESALTEMCFFWTYYYPRHAEQKVILVGVENSMYKDAGTPH
jgi:hypothetical protein